MIFKLFIFSYILFCYVSSQIENRYQESVPSFFFSEKETQIIRLNKFLGPYYKDFEVLSVDPDIFDFEISETVEPISSYNFASHQSIFRTRYFNDSKCLILLYPSKFLMYFLEIKNNKYIEIKSFERIKYTIKNPDITPEDITCYDVIKSPITNEIVMDCDLIIKLNDENFDRKSVFLIYNFVQNKLVLQDSIINQNSPNNGCVRKIRYKNEKLIRICDYQSKTMTSLANYNILEIFTFSVTEKNKLNIDFLLKFTTNYYTFEHLIKINDAVWIDENTILIIGQNKYDISAISYIKILYDGRALPYKVIDNKFFKDENIVRFCTIIDFSNSNNGKNLFLMYSNKSIYSIDFDKNKLKFISILNINESAEVGYLFNTREYLIMKFPKFLKIYKYSLNNSKLLVTKNFYHFFESPQFFFYALNSLFINEVESFAVISKSTMYTTYDSEIIWSLNISQICKRKVIVKCCKNESIVKYSMMPVVTKLKIENSYLANITLYYWNINDKNLYFFPIKSKFKFHSKNLLNSEKIYTNVDDYVVGPLTEANISKVLPIKEKFYISNTISKEIDFFNINKENPNITPQNFKTNTLFFKIEETNSNLQIFWHYKKEKIFYSIKCFEKNHDYISDCVVVLKTKIVFQIIAMAKFLDLRFILDENKNLFYVQQNSFIDTFHIIKENFYCENIFIVESSGLLFCVTTEKKYVQIYKLQLFYNEDDTKITKITFKNLVKNENFGISNLLIEQIFIDLFEFNCIIVKSRKSIYFVEIVPNFVDNLEFIVNLQKKEKIMSFYVRNEKYVPIAKSNIHILKDYLDSKLIIVDMDLSIIEEYSLTNPLDPLFLRKYPLFDKKIINSFFNLNRYLILLVETNNKRFLNFYDVASQTSNLLKKRYELQKDVVVYKIDVHIDLNTYNDEIKIYGRLFNIKPNDKIYVESIENNKLIGSIKNSLAFPQLMKKDFVTFKITLFFSNAMTDSIIFYTFNMDFVPNDVIITINPNEKPDDKTNQGDSDYLTQIYYEQDGNQTKYVLKDNLFKGPILNFHLDEYSDKNNFINRKEPSFILKNFDAYLHPTNNFIEYKTKIEKFGELICMTSFENILAVLSEKVLTFYNIEKTFTKIAQYSLANQVICEKIQFHNSKKYLIMFCKNKYNYSTPGVLLEIFKYSKKEKEKTNENNYENYNKPDKIENKNITKSNETSNNDSETKSNNSSDRFNLKNSINSMLSLTFEKNKSCVIDSDSKIISDYIVEHKPTKELDTSISDSSFISSIIFEKHLFILMNEYNSLSSVFYIYDLPSESNNFNVACTGKIVFNETGINDQYDKLSEKSLINSFIVFDAVENSSKDENKSHYGIIGLDLNMGYYFEIIIENYTANTEGYCNNLDIINLTPLKFKQEIEKSNNNTSKIKLFTLSKIKNEIIQNSTHYINNINFLLSTNLQIYEIQVQIMGQKIFTSIVYTYRKFYSCAFIDSFKPIMYREFVGSFCVRDYVDNTKTSLYNNYFILYKKLTDEKESNPIRALPLLIDKYDFDFYLKFNEKNETTLYLILPSYLNLFQEYIIDKNLTLISSSSKNIIDLNKKYILTAYNDISNFSLIIDFNNYQNESKADWRIIILIIFLSLGLLLLLTGLFYYFMIKYFYKKRPLVFNEENLNCDDNRGTYEKDSKLSASLASTFISMSGNIEDNKPEKKLEKIKTKETKPRYSAEEKVKKKIKDFMQNF